MTQPADEQNETFAHTEPDVVTKPDGRYLIYYSWPGLDDDEPDVSSSGQPSDLRSRSPDQRPWSPEGGPADE